MPRGGQNQKAVAAKEKKAAAQAIKDTESARKAEAANAADWAKGSNARGAARAESAAQKADEAARKRREKAELLAMEEEAAGSGKKIIKPKKAGAASSKKGGKNKKKKNNDLSMLEDSLIGDAEKKTKEKKRLERIKREKEARAAAERERKANEDRAKRDPLLANTDVMLGMEGADEEEGGVGAGGPMAVGRAANVASMANLQASGLDSALSAMSVAGGDVDERHPEKRRKAAYKAYEEKMMPEMKEQYPGLKRQQYLDKIFALWKKSPENPMNQTM
mmetsp:Transcript_27374/g.57110  ORF Transcript_27374/g.57110 Transcript_27374/m.57110 type:complete len:277 (-) Transcript_27374:379-1209(-)